ncbi:MAG: hypothetical protein EXS35_05825 [Pedosphaera sp.]|nr:hypothetical protein [Pedosphaera sp.]
MTSRLPLRRLFSLSLLLFTLTAARAQTAEDFFHGGAMFYLSNNIPAAKAAVTNGLQRFPDDVKLKKLEELLNQQQQSQSQQQQQQQEQKQDEQKKDQEQKKPEPSPQDQKPQESKSDEKKPEEQKPMQAHAMTPEEAKQLLDAQKGEEQVLQFRPQEPKNRGKVLKDW